MTLLPLNLSFVDPRYTDFVLVGTGGMATVIRARDAKLNRDVAIKVLHHGMELDPEAVERFRNEAKTVSMLNHNNILTVYDFEIETPKPYIVMQYLRGGTLKDVIERQGRIPFHEILNIMKQVVRGISYAHSRQVIHRDLKPSNIMLDAQASVYVADFGISRTKGVIGRTRTDNVIGTPGYMAPEQITDFKPEDLDHRVDIYALGVIVFEMATGVEPYQGSYFEVMSKHLNEPFPTARDLNENLPPGFDSVIQKAVAKDRNDRFGSVEEFYAALVAIAPPEAVHNDSIYNVREIIASAIDNIKEEPLTRIQTTRQASPPPNLGPTTSSVRNTRRPLLQWVNLALAIVAIGLLLIQFRPTSASQSDAGMPANGDILARVLERGHLRCGINGTLPGFSYIEAVNVLESRTATGFDADYCRVLAAAIFDPFDESQHVVFVKLNTAERLPALESGDVDVLMRNTTWNTARDLGYNIDYGPITFYDYQGLLVESGLNIETRDDLNGKTMCIIESATSYANLQAFAETYNIQLDYRLGNADGIYTSTAALFADVGSGICQMLTTDVSGMRRYAEVVPGIDFESGKHEILTGAQFSISKEPLTPIFPAGDAQWADIVNYSVYATILAAEYNVSSENIDDLIQDANTNIQTKHLLGISELGEDEIHVGTAIGLSPTFVLNIISHVGNYNEIIERNLPEDVQMEGSLNRLWMDGGLLYSPPFNPVPVRERIPFGVETSQRD
jgi:general L-amino acid transport system substrate-binding protein